MLQPITPTFDYLPWEISQSLEYIQSLTPTSESRLFGSVVRALDFYSDRPDSNPTKYGIFFFSYASWICYNFHAVRYLKKKNKSDTSKIGSESVQRGSRMNILDRNWLINKHVGII